MRQVLPRIEAALAPFDPAPHWGKLHTMPARDEQARYAFRQYGEHRLRQKPVGWQPPRIDVDEYLDQFLSTTDTA